MIRLVVVSAGLSEVSSTRLMANRIADEVLERIRVELFEEASVQLVDVRDSARDVTEFLLTGVRSERLTEVIEALGAADALIMATPVFQASYSGMFKAFIDVLDPKALAGKPVLLAATGGSHRHALVVDQQMRPLFGYLQAHVVPTSIFGASSECTTDLLPDSEASLRVARASRELTGLLRLNQSVGRA